MMRAKYKSVSIEFDRNYGMDNRTGWSIAVDGSYRAQLEPWLIVALWKSFISYPS